MGWRDAVDGFNVLRRAGLLQLERPDRLVRAARAYRAYGPTVAATLIGAAERHPDRLCIVDERGRLTWGEVEERTNSLARGLRQAGIEAGDVVALMCRNHRGFVESLGALDKLGAGVLLMNTSFAGPQLRDVLDRERPAAIIYDDEFSALLEVDSHSGRGRFVAALDEDGDAPDVPSIDDLIGDNISSRPPPPPAPGRIIALTSGTTGTPKGAARELADVKASLAAGVAMLERIPYHAGDVMCIAAPLFHGWGFGNLSAGLALGATFVLRRRFDPHTTIADIADHGATVLALVPVMLQRIMALPTDERAALSTSSLRLVALSGSAIPAGVAERFMEEHGELVYNLYGSTEIGWVSIATPHDLITAPGTAGRPVRGTAVRLLDDEGREASRGASGRIFVGSDLTFDGYTDGGRKEVVDGFMSTGDTGCLDAAGRLFVEGRDDEMIVSGGENVFPREVEDLLAIHPAVDDAAVIGVEDVEFGQRLVAFVVRSSDDPVDESALQQYVRENLARFKVPREVHFVAELPRNPTGKVLKRVLVEGHATGSVQG